MEELVLTEPVTKSKFRIVALTLTMEGAPGPPQDEPSASIVIRLKDNLDTDHGHMYLGQEAQDFIKFINTANFTTKSLNKRILEKLSADGILPGTVVGTPG